MTESTRDEQIIKIMTLLQLSSLRDMLNVNDIKEEDVLMNHILTLALSQLLIRTDVDPLETSVVSDNSSHIIVNKKQYKELFSNMQHLIDHVTSVIRASISDVINNCDDVRLKSLSSHYNNEVIKMVLECRSYD